MSPITELFPSDTELFLLTVGHNVNINKLHAVHCSRGHNYLCGDNTAGGDITLCVEE
jgi:hypothetical protein